MAGINLNDGSPSIMAGGIPWIRFNNQAGVGRYNNPGATLA
jgi:hypothetical protein